METTLEFAKSFGKVTWVSVWQEFGSDVDYLAFLKGGIFDFSRDKKYLKQKKLQKTFYFDQMILISYFKIIYKLQDN